VQEAAIAREVWPDVKIIGAEPTEDRRRELQSTFPGELLPYVVGDRDDTYEFYVNPDKRLWSCFGGPGDEKITLPGIKLDTMSEKYGPFVNAVVWADIEGSELAMLLGARKLMEQGCIVGFHLEVRPAGLFDGWCTAGQVHKFLTSYDFELVYTLKPKGRSKHYDAIYVASGCLST